jgi:hypothetical protein
MPMARYERGNDATAARKLTRSEPLSGRNARADETPRRSSSIERLKPGDDPRPAIGRLYREGRTYPDKPPHDYEARERTPEYKVPQPGRNDEYASYKFGRNSPVTPAPDESQPQFQTDKAAHLNDTREGWQRGMGSQSPHPHFDSGPSGSRYRK